MKKTKITLLIPAMLDDHFDLLKYAFDSEYVHTVLLKNTVILQIQGLSTLITTYAIPEFSL